MPSPPNGLGLDLIDFHPTEPDWLLYVAGTICPGCHSIVYYSANNGANWDEPFDTYVSKCVFAEDTHFMKVERDAIFCTAYHQKSGSQDAWSNAASTPTGNILTLYKYPNFGRRTPIKLAEKVVQYYVFENYMAVATENHSQVDLLISVDGTNFAEARFPPNMELSKNAFTILQSTTGSVFLDVYQNMRMGQQTGILFTSNINGTFYSMSLMNTNRNQVGFVDFEKVQSMDGIILANQVGNAEQLSMGAKKQVQTVISFNDGGNFNRVPAPADIKCSAVPGAGSDSCFLNLHSRTDVPDPGPVFSAKSSPGLLMGVGNVGPYLIDYNECDTFLTRDAGRSWSRIKSGANRFEFGDHGALLV